MKKADDIWYNPKYKEEPIILVKDQKKLEIMKNPVYYPIIAMLREGPMTVEEMEKKYLEFVIKDAKKQGIKGKKEIEEYVEKNKRSSKSLYRYVQHLMDLNFVALYGKIISEENPMPTKLFARTAKFFFVDDYFAKVVCEEPHCTKSMKEILSLIYNIPEPDDNNVIEFTSALKDSFRRITSILLKDKPEEFVNLVDDLSLTEITDVIQILSLMDLVKNSEKFSKLLDDLKK